MRGSVLRGSNLRRSILRGRIVRRAVRGRSVPVSALVFDIPDRDHALGHARRMVVMVVMVRIRTAAARMVAVVGIGMMSVGMVVAVRMVAVLLVAGRILRSGVFMPFCRVRVLCGELQLRLFDHRLLHRLGSLLPAGLLVAEVTRARRIFLFSAGAAARISALIFWAAHRLIPPVPSIVYCPRRWCRC